MPKAKKTTKAEPTTPEKSTASKDNASTAKRWPIFVGGGVIVIILVGIIAYFGFEYTYKDKVYPGVELNGTSLAGLDYNEVVAEINSYKTDLEETGMVFTYGDTTFTLETVIETEASDGTTVPLIQIDTDQTAQAIFGIGREQSSAANISAKLSYLLTPHNVDVVYEVDSDTITSILTNEFAQYETPYVNADVQFTDDGAIAFTDHVDGQTFDWDMVINEVENRIAELEPVHMDLELVPMPAPIPTTVAETHAGEIEQVMALAPLTLTYEDMTYEVSAAELQNWLTITETNRLDIDGEAVDVFLDSIAGEIDVPVKEGRFSLDIIDGEVKLTQFQNGENGLGVNTDKTVAEIQAAILDNKVATIPLVVEVTEPRATPDNLDDLGVKELLGTGETNFAGSPVNRVGNIRKGAELLNGLLIAPGEEFSLVGILSPIDTAHGWLSELVIKGDKLEKEAGGGLCQIGSTVFRATMNSGLEITERRNHSWAISYYAYNGKAGVDATIYEPSPDYKFVNDTENWVLIRSIIEGTVIKFEFWGTSDGRKGYFTEPVNYGHVSAGAAIEEVDETKPPGYRQCDHAYNGVSASFDYIIERPDGSEDVTEYQSTYKARPMRCIVGPAATEEPEVETPAEDPTPEAPTETPDEPEETVNTNTNTNSNTNTDTNKNTNKKKDKKD